MPTHKRVMKTFHWVRLKTFIFVLELNVFLWNKFQKEKGCSRTFWRTNQKIRDSLSYIDLWDHLGPPEQFRLDSGGNLSQQLYIAIGFTEKWGNSCHWSKLPGESVYKMITYSIWGYLIRTKNSGKVSKMDQWVDVLLDSQTGVPFLNLTYIPLVKHFLVQFPFLLNPDKKEEKRRHSRSRSRSRRRRTPSSSRHRLAASVP